MNSFALYCKSYSTDLKRIVRLARSVLEFNIEKIPFYISVKKSEFSLFHEHLNGLEVNLLCDEDILAASPRIDLDLVNQLPGSLSQQIIKSEFWRLNCAVAYLCLDSDAIFIRPFSIPDFIAPDGTPYTVVDEAHDLLEAALHHKQSRIITSFNYEATLVQKLFGREGRRYSFGPFPLVWHSAVWDSLDKQYLQPRAMNLAEAILQAPIESRWYGEALLAFKAVPLLPCQAHFKVYHYAWQYDQDMRNRVHVDQLRKLYCGVIYQSAWERNMDWPTEGGGFFSRTGRRIRRFLKRV